jgi:hypothetical protein
LAQFCRLHEFKQALRKNEKLLESMLNHLRGAPVQELRAEGLVWSPKIVGDLNDEF